MDGLYLIDAPQRGAANMAIDQAMLEASAASGKPMLRVYQWSEPTVSLGYFQKYDDFCQHACNAAPDAVRRATGGGAIVHHHDWTYALAVPDDFAARFGAGAIGPAEPVYDCVHDAVVAWLNHLGWAARKWSDADKAESHVAKSSDFLCFARRTRGDVVVGAHKVMGSAQRRTRGALLQHGSLLLAQSAFANELPGLAELPCSENQAQGDNNTQQPVLAKFAQAIQAAVESLGDISFCEVSRLEEILVLNEPLEAKYTTSEWLERV